MDDLKQLWIFRQVAALRSFSRAADELSLTRSRVSQAVRELEEAWGVRLIIRTTRTVTLTPAGERLLAVSTDIVSRVEQARVDIAAEGQTARGHLKVASPVDVGEVCLAPLAARFRADHPDVSVELVFEDAVVNLAAEGIDLSVRVGWLKDSSMQAVRIAPMEPVVCAAPSLLKGKEKPKTPQDLLSFEWVALSLLDAPLRWTFESKRGNRTQISASGQVVCNSPVAMRALILAGAGIGVCPDYQVQDDLRAGRLVRLLPDHHLRTGGVYAIHQYNRNPPLRVRLFLEYLKKHWPDRNNL
jgi:DNA-binding transcriptional LysR family regulator